MIPEHSSNRSGHLSRDSEALGQPFGTRAGEGPGRGEATIARELRRAASSGDQVRISNPVSMRKVREVLRLRYECGRMVPENNAGTTERVTVFVALVAVAP